MSYNASGYDDDGKVNINTADPSELQTIPGIGPSKAQAIIEYREKQRLFYSPGRYHERNRYRSENILFN